MKKFRFMLLCLLLLILPISAMAEAPLPLYSNLAEEAVLSEAVEALQAHGLDNAPLWGEWAADFNNAAANARLTASWSSEIPQPDVPACMDGWEAAHDFSDANCRMTAFLLLQDALRMEGAVPEYDGTYLMFDLDAIETVPRYAPLLEQKSRFAALFGEEDVHGLAPEEIAEAYGSRWQRLGCALDLPGVSLISVVIHDPYDQVVFVGHTGILLEQEGELLFLEKIAFEQPYQATRCADLEQLAALLRSRPEYWGNGSEQGPFLYRNEVLLNHALVAKPQEENGL